MVASFHIMLVRRIILTTLLLQEKIEKGDNINSDKKKKNKGGMLTECDLFPFGFTLDVRLNPIKF